MTSDPAGATPDSADAAAAGADGPMRTDYCGDLRLDDIGRQVAVCGWVARRREHGEHLAFIDVRDRSGLVQCVVDGAHDLRSEYVVRVTGTVRRRPEGTANPGLPTGEIELGPCEVEILSVAEPPPFQIDERVEVDETIRLRYRYLDLRAERMQRNLQVRATVHAKGVQLVPGVPGMNITKTVQGPVEEFRPDAGP